MAAFALLTSDLQWRVFGGERKVSFEGGGGFIDGGGLVVVVPVMMKKWEAKEAKESLFDS